MVRTRPTPQSSASNASAMAAVDALRGRVVIPNLRPPRLPRLSGQPRFVFEPFDYFRSEKARAAAYLERLREGRIGIDQRVDVLAGATKQVSALLNGNRQR